MIDEKKLIEEVRQWYWDKGLQEVDGEWADLWIDMFIRTIKKQPKVGEWIPFDEIKPMHNQYVLSIDSEGEMEVMYFDKEWQNCLCKWGGSLKTFNIVAWMPLPKAYEVQDD